METDSMGLTTGRRPVPDNPGKPIGVTKYRWVKTNNGFEFQEMGYKLPDPPREYRLPNPLPEIPQKVELTCKEQFCKLKFMGVPGTEFCSFDCQLWHESLSR